MGRIIGLALVALVLGSTVVDAQTINLRTFKCADFVKLKPDTRDLVAIWLDGHLADDEAPDGLTVDFSGSDADGILAICKKSPGTDLLKAAEQAE
ncbi:MAG: HdeA/HdeB family chaperone [Hyphomicrobiaceae bacterium]